jgi:hypothetical protein
LTPGIEFTVNSLFAGIEFTVNSLFAGIEFTVNSLFAVEFTLWFDPGD